MSKHVHRVLHFGKPKGPDVAALRRAVSDQMHHRKLGFIVSFKTTHHARVSLAHCVFALGLPDDARKAVLKNGTVGKWTQRKIRNPILRSPADRLREHRRKPEMAKWRREHRRPAEKEGVDWSYGKISAASLKAAGKNFAGRYFSYTSEKNLSPQEAKDLSAAGEEIVVFWETTGDRAKEGHTAGEADAREALSQGKTCGMPDSAPIFFAIDFEAQGPEVLPYFQGVDAVMGKGRRAAYGGKGAITYLFDHGVIDYACQTYGWSYGEWDPRAKLRQVQNGVIVAGVEVDLEQAIARDYGGWLSTLA